MIKKVNKIFSKESFLVLSLIILNTLNLLFFTDNTTILTNSVFILGIYFYLSDRKDKKVLLLTLLHFSFYGVIFESLIIRHTNVLKYKNPNKYINIPLWLFPIYCSFALGAIETYKIFNLIIKK
tara:strand:- start:52 stop:423 length:372 start_codon:yes stop_codon:yes gene_type:complete